MDATYHIEAVTTVADLLQDQAWWHIYRTSFPEHELEPPEAILNCLAQQAGLTLRVKQQQATIAIAHGQYLKASSFFMLIYFAVHHAHRGMGVGKKLLSALEQTIKTSVATHHNGLVFEVDRPDFLSDPHHQHDALRRIHFYENLGYSLLPIPYFQPPLTDTAKPLPMTLMVKRTNLSLAQQKQLVHAIYFEKYCINNGISAISKKILDDLWQQYAGLSALI